MALSSSSSVPDSSSLHHGYSRKQKSLGLLCTNFLALYDRDCIDEAIGLDDAASKLGVERRRIYDIVNVLESVGIMVRRAKNQYTWKGFGAIPKTLQELKVEGLKDTNQSYDGHSSAKLSDDEYDEEESSNPNTGSQNDSSKHSSNFSTKIDNRREKSLGLLTQNFIKIFVCTDAHVISLDEAARLLLGDAHSSSTMRTKVRRLYDIANVLSSLNLIEKTHTLDTRKPAFRWLGYRGKTKNESGDVLALNESRKRAFGTDVTNISIKRHKEASSMSQYESPKMEKQTKAEGDHGNSDDDSMEVSKSFNFGPFAPGVFSRVGATEDKKRQAIDVENLASTYRPHYQNQALKDLFGHYKEAWHSWYGEVEETKPLHHN